MRQGSFQLSILVNGDPVQELYEEASDTTWIPAISGEEFDIFVENGTDRRISAVATVDGLSVMDGKPGSYRSPGYVVEPHSASVIPGWRLDPKNVAKFQFDSVSEGYATRMGYSPSNIGVIACAFFEEKIVEVEPPQVFEGRRTRYQRVYPGPREMTEREAEAPTDDIAVRFGKKTPFSTVASSFRRASREPKAVLKIRYDSARGLRRRGIGCEQPEGWSG